MVAPGSRRDGLTVVDPGDSMPSLLQRLAGDLRAGAAASMGGAAALALVEWIATLVAAPGPIGISAALRLLLLDVTLISLLWLALLIPCTLAAAGPRVLHALTAGSAAAARAPRWWSAPTGWPPCLAPTILAGGLAAVGYAGTLTWLGARWDKIYREPVLLALLVAVAAVALGAVFWIAARIVAGLLERARRYLARLSPPVARWSLGSPWVAAAAVAFAGASLLLTIGGLFPYLRGVWPWRRLLGLVAFIAGNGLYLEWAAFRARRVTSRPARRKARRRLTALAAAAPAAILIPLTLTRCGGDPEVKYLAVTASPTLSSTIDLVRKANDVDGDGFGSLLGENDCAPRDRKIRPGVRDLPDDGIDQNCDGRDPSLRDLVVPAGVTMAVPPAFQKPWNVLLITVDTVRYDHTSFGGYKGTHGRDTTPRLAELVERSTSFTFAQAPSAGTMASIPAILTSKFFHSGIALDENVRHNFPPRIKPENVTLPELMKQQGYVTGAVLSHDYFNDWGLEQGIDHYDNEIGATHDAWRVSADRVTDRGLAWIARHSSQKWFLWLHYLDPHSQYALHPGEPSFGSSQKDRYDGELRFTDKHIGRLLDELARLPGAERTIIVLTSDHGDAFGEHGFDGHAIALFKEVIHVPLIFSVPDVPPRLVGGAVSNLDIVPTLAQLCGLDTRGLSFEGKSLVPQIFTGQEEPTRTVFAETNYPAPLRAAVNESWKLIYNMKGNFYELYDLKKDPLEKVNLAHRASEGMAYMKPIMDAWLERVVFSRDAAISQAAMRMEEVLLRTPPVPQRATPGLTFDGGAVEVLGFDPPGLRRGRELELHVYLRAVRTPTRGFRFSAVLWGVPAAGQMRVIGIDQSRSPSRVTLDGLLPSDQWKPGDIIKETFQFTLPVAWRSPFAAIGLSVAANNDPPGWNPEAAKPDQDASVGILGVEPVDLDAKIWTIPRPK